MRQRVEIYLGPAYDPGSSESLRHVNALVGTIAEQFDFHCHLGPEYCRKFGCHIAYEEFSESDERPREFARRVNQLRGISAKVVEYFS